MSEEESYISNVGPDVYRKLQMHLNTLPIGFPATESGVDLKLLKFLFTPDEALIGRNMRLIPESPQKIFRRVKKYGISLEQLENVLKRMYKKGSINVKRIQEGDSEVFHYHNAFLAVGMFEYQLHRMTPEFYNNFEQYMDEVFRDEVASTKINQLRTIPIEESITPEHHIASHDELKNLIDNADRIAVQDCVCRQGKDLLGRPCKFSDLREVCFVLNSSVQHIIDNEKGREITKQEAYEIFEKVKQAGFIIQPGNAINPNFICCCCGDCCDMLTNIKKLERPLDMIHSNYFAAIEDNKCVGCGSCLERCQMEAISLNDLDLAEINRRLCIGCGNCVITCPEEAIKLIKKKTEEKPPFDTTQLYLKIMDKKAELRRKEKGIE
jgi:NAD-dependent dihydropyrimidine dehydrogenase PreA subunit